MFQHFLTSVRAKAFWWIKPLFIEDRIKHGIPGGRRGTSTWDRRGVSLSRGVPPHGHAVWYAAGMAGMVFIVALCSDVAIFIDHQAQSSTRTPQPFSAHTFRGVLRIVLVLFYPTGGLRGWRRPKPLWAYRRHPISLVVIRDRNVLASIMPCYGKSDLGTAPGQSALARAFHVD